MREPSPTEVEAEYTAISVPLVQQERRRTPQKRSRLDSAYVICTKLQDPGAHDGALRIAGGFAVGILEKIRTMIAGLRGPHVPEFRTRDEARSA